MSIRAHERKEDSDHYLEAGVGDKSEKRHNLQIAINLILGPLKLVNNAPPHCQKVEITLILAALNQHIGPP